MGGACEIRFANSENLKKMENTMEKIKKPTKWMEKAMNLLFLVCGLITILSVMLITVFLVVSGIPAIRTIGFTDFLFGRVWASTAGNPSYGILPFIQPQIGRAHV